MLDYETNHKISTIPEFINVLKMAEKKGKETTPKETSLKGICFYCGQNGHWKRNYKAYLESKKKVACDTPSSLGIYVIKVNTVSSNYKWVYDNSCGSYIWIDKQVLRNSRKLVKGESDLRVGNGARVIVAALWTYVLNLYSDLCLKLEDCCYVRALTRNIIFF